MEQAGKRHFFFVCLSLCFTIQPAMACDRMLIVQKSSDAKESVEPHLPYLLHLFSLHQALSAQGIGSGISDTAKRKKIQNRLNQRRPVSGLRTMLCLADGNSSVAMRSCPPAHTCRGSQS